MRPVLRYAVSGIGGIAVAAVAAMALSGEYTLFSPFLATAVVYAVLFNYSIEYWDLLTDVDIDHPGHVIGMFTVAAGFGAASLFRLDLLAGVLGLGIGLVGYVVGISMGQFVEPSNEPTSERPEETTGDPDSDRGPERLAHSDGGTPEATGGEHEEEHEDDRDPKDEA